MYLRLVHTLDYIFFTYAHNEHLLSSFTLLRGGFYNTLHLITSMFMFILQQQTLCLVALLNYLNSHEACPEKTESSIPATLI